jgi:hypothetical protein
MLRKSAPGQEQRQAQSTARSTSPRLSRRGHSETVALATAAVLAGVAAAASAARLYHPGGARPLKPAMAVDAP